MTSDVQDRTRSCREESTAPAALPQTTLPNAPHIAGFTRDQQRRALRPRSIERRRAILCNLDRFVGARSFFDLSPDDLNDWLDAVDRAPRTRYSYLSTMACFYEWAIGVGLTDINPAAKIDRPRISRSLPRPIGRDDLAHAILNASPMLLAWLLLAALAGLRCQEIAGLRREDVWDQDDPPMLFVAEAKGGNERVVPLHPEALAALRRYGMPARGPIFRNRDGRQFTPTQTSRRANDYLHSIGIEATMHQLRHRFGTDVQDLGGDLRVTQELMGHLSPLSTAGYSAVNPTKSADVVRRLSLARANHPAGKALPMDNTA